jgi:nicotinamidase/pyrazinamidase
MIIDAQRSVLLLVDVQIDFLAGGALAVGDGGAILEPLARLLDDRLFSNVVATQDWHPPGHVSFASTHGRKPFESITLYGEPQVLWPDHCVAGTPGAELSPLLPWRHVRAILRKGTNAAVDSYSGFRDNWNAAHERPATGLGGYLAECGWRDVYVCGLARDFCVKWTAEDAADLGFRTTVLWDLTRPVDAASDGAVRASLGARGVAIADAASLRRA